MFSGLVALGIAVIGLAAWSGRQEGRITAHDELFEEREKQELIRFTAVNQRFDDATARLKRIEDKLDSLNGKSH